MSVRKTLSLVKHAAEDAGVEWPESSFSSAKKQRIEEPNEENSFKCPSDLMGPEDLQRF